MKSKGIFLMIVLSLLTVVVMTNPAAAQKAPIIAVMLPNGGDPYFQAKWYGYEVEAKKLGVNLIFYDAGGYANVNKQISSIEDVIQRKVDGIIFTATSSTATVPAIEKAIKAGIHVVNDNVYCKTDMIKARVMKNDYEIGMLQATGLIEYHGRQRESPHACQVPQERTWRSTAKTGQRIPSSGIKGSRLWTSSGRRAPLPLP